MVRRLPIYILADTSGSMVGDPIEAVKQGIRSLQANLLGDPSTMECAYLSIITFDDTARQVAPLTNILSFVPPDIDAGGVSALGDALQLLLECMDREVRRLVGDHKGDYRPLVFLLTDGTPTSSHGEPTENWRAPAAEVKRRLSSTVVAVACGEHASVQTLKEITDTVLFMRDMSPDSFSSFFKWMSDSIEEVVRETPRGSIHLPPPPPTVLLVPQ